MTIEHPLSLGSIVLNRLRGMIVDGELELGAVLSERRIAEDLNVSKTPVREAFAQLRNEGLVTIVPQSGVRVFTMSARSVREMCEFRLALESASIAGAMRNDPVAVEQQLAAIVSAMAEAQANDDRKAYLELDTAFHSTFFDHCRNEFLRGAYDLYRGKIAALRTHLAVKPRHTSLSFAEHEAMLEAVRKRDTDRLLDILKTHIGRTQNTYAITIEDIAAADADEERPELPRR